jgi:hypothetical protein
MGDVEVEQNAEVSDHLRCRYSCRHFSAEAQAAGISASVLDTQSIPF